ncbi:MAG: galactokinase [Myxococcales bacterium]|nr:galactokinase [Myxococcales bacterium]
MSRTPELTALFHEKFNAAPAQAAFAPGRVNLIGEHTDYNDGFVLPLAIQFGVYLAGRVTSDGRVRAHSANFPDEPVDFPLGEEPRGKGWGQYLRAVLYELAAVGVRPAGLELVFIGDVPPEAGLSSSAAFSVVTSLLVSALVGRSWDDKVALAKLCQAAEHRTGVMCGLLDQMASAACQAGSAMLLDCRDLSRRMVALDRQKLAVIVGDTTVKRSLNDGRYNQRRAECEAAARAFGVRALRDVTPELLAAKTGSVEDVLVRRARHVMTEDDRVHGFAAALAAGDLATVGRLVDQGHASLRDDFEVSCPELDAICEAFRGAGAYGARMVGAGFGGSAIAVVAPEKAADVIAGAAAAYRQKTGRSGVFHVVAAGDGAAVFAI